MKKLTKNSLDLKEKNIEKLKKSYQKIFTGKIKELFPTCITFSKLY